MKLSFGQGVVVWIVTIISFLGAFYFGYIGGFMFGRDEGMATALDQHQNQSVRLPVPPPSGEMAPEMTTPEIAANLQEMPPVEAIPEAREEPEIDFGAVAALASVEEEPQPEIKMEPVEIARIEKEPIVIEPKVPKPLPVKVDPKPSPKTDSFAEMSDEEKIASLIRGDLEGDAPGSLNIGADSGPKVNTTPPIANIKTARVKTREPSLPKPSGSRMIVARGSAEPKEDMSGINMNPKPVAGWYLQVAAAKSESEARFLHNRVQLLDMPVVVQPATINKTQYYRILIGPYESKSVAKSKGSSVKRAGISRGEPFVKNLSN